MVKRKEEDRRNRQKILYHCPTPCKISERKRYAKGEEPSKLMIREKLDWRNGTCLEDDSNSHSHLVPGMESGLGTASSVAEHIQQT